MIIKMIKRILKISGKYSANIKKALVFAIIESILSKMPIFYAFTIIVKFQNKTINVNDVIYTLIALISTVILQMFMHYYTDKLQSGSGFQIFADMRMELGNHLRKLPMGYFTKGNLGKINSVLTGDMSFIEEVCMSVIANMMNYIFSATLMIGFMFYLNPYLGITSLCITVVATLISNYMNKNVSLKGASERQKQAEALTYSVLEFIKGIDVVKSFNLLITKSKELKNEFKKSEESSIRFEHSMTPWIILLNIVYAIGIISILYLSLIFNENGTMQAGYIFGVLLFVFDLFGPIKALYGEASRLTVMNSCLDRIEEVFSESQLKDEGKLEFPELKNDIEVEFKNVSFGYNNKNDIENISFSMKKNSMTALIGRSGSGKSTIANLLTRFWDVKDGEILVRGNNIQKYSMESLMNNISVVFQRVYLFQDTIYNNILIGNPKASKEDIIKACKKARCYDFIMSLPDGLNTMVGAGGATLSGGEKQRISIARCILKDAPIIILDEATASVDTDNESYIQEAINELVKGKTLLVIAHRLNTIKAADQILTIQEGRIVKSLN